MTLAGATEPAGGAVAMASGRLRVGRPIDGCLFPDAVTGGYVTSTDLRLSPNSCHDAEDAFHGFLELALAFGRRTFVLGKNRLLLGRRVKLLKLGN